MWFWIKADLSYKTIKVTFCDRSTEGVLGLMKHPPLSWQGPQAATGMQFISSWDTVSMLPIEYQPNPWHWGWWSLLCFRCTHKLQRMNQQKDITHSISTKGKCVAGRVSMLCVPQFYVSVILWLWINKSMLYTKQTSDQALVLPRGQYISRYYIIIYIVM